MAASGRKRSKGEYRWLILTEDLEHWSCSLSPVTQVLSKVLVRGEDPWPSLHHGAEFLDWLSMPSNQLDSNLLWSWCQALSQPS